MRRDVRDEILRSFLVFNSALREEVRDVRRLLKARQSEAKYNPNWRLQPRAPRGTAEGGQWVDGGGGKPRPQKQAQPEYRPRHEHPPRTPGAQGDPANDNERLSRARFGPRAALLAGDAILRQMADLNERARVIEVIARYELDPNSARDVLAARAHVWVTHLAPSILVAPFSRLPFDGPVTNRAAEALMRFERAHPGALGLAEAGDTHARRAVEAIIEASLDGRPTPVLTIPLLGPGQGVITFNERETELVAAMRVAGRSTTQIQTALDTIRRNRGEDARSEWIREEPGTAYNSRPLVRISERWMRGTDLRLGLFPAQVAERLRGSNLQQLQRV